MPFIFPSLHHHSSIGTRHSNTTRTGGTPSSLFRRWSPMEIIKTIRHYVYKKFSRKKNIINTSRVRFFLLLLLRLFFFFFCNIPRRFLQNNWNSRAHTNFYTFLFFLIWHKNVVLTNCKCTYLRNKGICDNYIYIYVRVYYILNIYSRHVSQHEKTMKFSTITYVLFTLWKCTGRILKHEPC